VAAGARAFGTVLVVASLRAAAGPCPPETHEGCKGFLKGKHLALAAVLGSGVDAGPLEAVGVTPDGRLGYGLRSDGALDEWDLGTGALRRVTIARFIALDPDGRWGIAPQARKGLPASFWSSHGSGFELWDLASRRRVAATKVEWEEPLTFAFSRRRVVVRILAEDEGALVWDTTSGKVRRPRGGFCAGVVVLTPDGTRAVCTGDGGGGGDDDDDDEIPKLLKDEDDAGVAVWDLDRMKIVRRLPARAGKNRGSVSGLAVSPDGGKALIAFSQGREGPYTSIVWNLASGKVDKGPALDEAGGSRLRWSPAAGKLLWIWSGRDAIAHLSPGTGNDKRKTTLLGDPDDRASDAVFLPDGKRILTGTSGRGVMRLVAAADGRTLRASREVSGHLGEVLGLSISRDGKRMVSCGKDHMLRLWDLQNNQPLRSIQLDLGVDPVALMAPDGAFAITTLKGLSLVKLPEGTVRQTLLARVGGTYALSLSPDGGLVLVGNTLWEIPSGREVWSQNEIGPAAAFSADQRRIYASPSSYRTIFNVIDVGSGVVKTALGKTGAYGASGTRVMALAPREDFIISHGGKDDRAFWGPGEYELVGRFDIPSGRFAWTIAARTYVRQVAVSPDGRWFVLAGAMRRGGDEEDPMERFASRVELRSTADGTVADALDLDSVHLTTFSAAFTPDGRALIVGTDDGPILRFAVTP
jgi:WD40 repeat protein